MCKILTVIPSLFFSSPPGTLSYRQPGKGSIFISNFTKVLNDFGDVLDFEAMARAVCRNMTREPDQVEKVKNQLATVAFAPFLEHCLVRRLFLDRPQADEVGLNDWMKLSYNQGLIINQQEQKLDDLANQLQQTSLKTDQMHFSYIQDQQKIKQLEAENMTHTSQKTEYEKKIKQKSSKIDTLKSERANFEIKSTIARQENDILRKEKELWLHTEHEFNLSVSQLTAQRDTAKVQMSKYKKSKSALGSKMDQLSLENKTLELAMASLQTEVTSLKTEKVEMRKVTDQLTHEAAQVKCNNDTVTNNRSVKFEELNTQNRHVEEAVTALRSRNEILETDNDNLLLQIKEISVHLAALKSDNVRFDTRSESIEKMLNTLTLNLTSFIGKPDGRAPLTDSLTNMAKAFELIEKDHQN